MTIDDGASGVPRRPALSGLPLYALIDPYLGDARDDGYSLAKISDIEVLGRIRRNAWDGREVFHAPMRKPVIEAHRLPYVVRIESNDDVFNELIKLAFDEHRAAIEATSHPFYRVGTFIETWMEPVDLMRRLEMMWSYRQHVPKTRYLRIGDRRVFESITYLIAPEPLSRWLGPIAHWHVLDREFQWISAHGDDEQWYVDPGFGWRRIVDATRTLDGAALSLTAQQHRCLVDLEAIARALLAWQRASRSLSSDTYRLASTGVSIATDQGLTEQTDKAAFAYRWMRDSDFTNTPAAIEAIRRHRTQVQVFAESIESIERQLSAGSSMTHVDTTSRSD